MNNTIEVTWKDGKVWRIHRSILSKPVNIDDAKRFARKLWLDERQSDLFLSLFRMEQEGIQIDNEIKANYR